MKNPFLLLALLLIGVACGSGNTDLPLVNSVSALNNQSATAVPLTDDQLFMVSGRVSHSIFVLTQGLLALEDPKNPEQKIYLLAKNKHKIGEVVTLQVRKKEVLSIDDKSYAVYAEN